MADHGGSKDFTTKIADGVATLTFTRPEKANAFHPRIIPLMKAFFIELHHRPDVRVVVIRGEGKHFMAGGDLETIVDLDSASDAERTSYGEGPITEYNAMVRAMQRLDKPVLASVQGGVAGAGVGFIGACDLVIAADTAFFWAAHILHGGSNDGLLTYFLPRHVGLRKALELALLGDRIKAPEAKELGLINFVVPEAELQAATDKLVARLASGPTLGYGKIKKLMYASLQNSMFEQGVMEAESYGSVLHTADVKDGLRAFFEKRPPNFQGK
jgi:2-(1,2-epoxy-1,2-dihydrophenyl)acetyl-CoA isomerase